ncbi:MAG: metal ABC transporter permease [Candidatus Moduliflexus flocculans]|nr:metal ABC transporter permease [Candidatus Moduliflexus flocculans]
MSALLAYGFLQRAFAGRRPDRRRLRRPGRLPRPAQGRHDRPRPVAHRLRRRGPRPVPERPAPRRRPWSSPSAAAVAVMKLKDRAGLHGDTAIGIFSSLGMAVGILLASLARSFNVELMAYLFGDILAIEPLEVGLTVGPGRRRPRRRPAELRPAPLHDLRPGIGPGGRGQGRAAGHPAHGAHGRHHRPGDEGRRHPARRGARRHPGRRRAPGRHELPGGRAARRPPWPSSPSPAGLGLVAGPERPRLGGDRRPLLRRLRRSSSCGRKGGAWALSGSGPGTRSGRRRREGLGDDAADGLAFLVQRLPEGRGPLPTSARRTRRP